MDRHPSIGPVAALARRSRKRNSRLGPSDPVHALLGVHDRNIVQGLGLGDRSCLLDAVGRRDRRQRTVSDMAGLKRPGKLDERRLKVVCHNGKDYASGRLRRRGRSAGVGRAMVAHVEWMPAIASVLRSARVTPLLWRRGATRRAGGISRRFRWPATGRRREGRSRPCSKLFSPDEPVKSAASVHALCLTNGQQRPLSESGVATLVRLRGERRGGAVRGKHRRLQRRLPRD
jgi:hypothetical protein